jgi:hypothetical protein
VEEMAAAASGLKGQSMDLVNAVSVFKLQGGVTAAQPSRTAPAPATLARPAAPRQLNGASKPAPKAATKALARAPSPKLAAPPAKAPKAAAAADDEWETC